jgi:Antibiotic biosynthesis monooxygenase
MTTPTDANPQLLTVIAHMRAKPGKRPELQDALAALVGPTGAEEGFVNYDLHQGTEDPDLFTFTRTGRAQSFSTPTWPRRTWWNSPAGSTTWWPSRV